MDPQVELDPAKQIAWIDFVVAGYEVNSERHDRESHSVEAQLSTGEKLSLYDSSYYEKYSRMKHGPGNEKDASDEGREKLAKILTALGLGGAFSAATVNALALELEAQARKAKLPGTVETRQRGPPPPDDDKQCAQQ